MHISLYKKSPKFRVCWHA